jgi:acetyl-CoA carboxylase biotin carboxyl carrier protein
MVRGPMSAIDLEQLRQLIALLVDRDIAEFEHEKGGEKIRIVRGAVVHHAPPPLHAFGHAPPHLAMHAPPPAAPAPPPAGALAPTEDDGSVDVTSPFVGTFYRSPSPDTPPFCDVGSVVRQGQTLCIIEAMKLMNEIEAECSGTITEIFAQNGKAVEFGQKLFRIKKA